MCMRESEAGVQPKSTLLVGGGGAVEASVQANVPAGPLKGPRRHRGRAEENQAARWDAYSQRQRTWRAPGQRDLLSTDLNLPMLERLQIFGGFQVGQEK